MLRREFLRAGAAAGLALSALNVYAGAASDSKPKRVGLIGTGWYGKADLWRLNQVAPIEIVSMCDVDKRMLAEAADMAAERQPSKKKPRTYGDFREMLKEKDLDICLIATPDHWHALAAIEAMKAGADLYLQKPISVDVTEGQAVLAAARKYKRVVQIGTQRRSTPHLAEARDRFIREGKLGKIGLVEICCYYHMRARGNPADSPPPEYLDWEMWTGPAPMRPFNPIAHPRGWRAFMEYGNGIVGDMCVHMLDMTRWMMGLGWPKSIGSVGGILVQKDSKANISDTQTATFDFGDVNVVWQHRTWGSSPDAKYPWAGTFYGDKGTLKVSVNGYDFIAADKGAEPIHKDVDFELDKYPQDKNEKGIELFASPAVRYHMKDLLANIESRGRPVADVEEGYISTASCVLANISMQLGRSLVWDPAAGKVVGDDEANRLLRRPYRAPWTHPEADKV
jgi:predicted dehydrogenase